MEIKFCCTHEIFMQILKDIECFDARVLKSITNISYENGMATFELFYSPLVQGKFTKYKIAVLSVIISCLEGSEREKNTPCNDRKE